MADRHLISECEDEFLLGIIAGGALNLRYALGGLAVEIKNLA